MHSSTSSSELPRPVQAATRAEPVWERPVPATGRAAWLALVVFLLAMLAWEVYIREVQGIEPTYRNSPGLWAEQRRRIDRGEGDSWVIVGSSRSMTDIQLHEWEALTGERPIQLALEGSSPVPVMEQLAEDEDFTGTLLVGIAPGLFFSGYTFRSDAIERYGSETPSQWLGHKISVLFEPWLAFYTFDWALPTIVARQDWPVRDGTRPTLEVRKILDLERDRNTRLWTRLETDQEYAELAKKIWAQRGTVDDAPPPIRERMLAKRDAQLERAVAAYEKLTARGIEVVFVTLPYEGFYARDEPAYAPREDWWDVLLARTGALGLHFEDHPEMQGYTLPEWSHMSGSEADRFTRVFVPLLERELERWRAQRGEGGA